MIRTSFRLRPETIQRLDAIAAALRKRQVGNVTRADVLRMLIDGGLDRAEQQTRKPGASRSAPKPRKPRKPRAPR
jgi:predicted DNA-binding protein